MNVPQEQRTGGLRCPKCGSSSRVINSRQNPAHNSVKRRHVCANLACVHRFTSQQVIVPSNNAKNSVKRGIPDWIFSSGEVKVTRARRPYDASEIEIHRREKR